MGRERCERESIHQREEPGHEQCAQQGNEPLHSQGLGTPSKCPQCKPHLNTTTSLSTCSESVVFHLYSRSLALTKLCVFSPEAPRPAAADADQGARVKIDGAAAACLVVHTRAPTFCCAAPCSVLADWQCPHDLACLLAPRCRSARCSASATCPAPSSEERRFAHRVQRGPRFFSSTFCLAVTGADEGLEALEAKNVHHPVLAHAESSSPVLRTQHARSLTLAP